MKRILLGAAMALALSAPAFAATQTTFNVKDGSGNPQTLCTVTTPTGSLLAYCQDVYVQGAEASPTNPLPTAQSDVAGSGTIAAATASPSGAYVVNLSNGEGTVGFNLAGLTASGATLTVEAANNSGNWYVVNVVQPGTGALSNTITADGNYRVNAAGHTAVRLRVSVAGTGTINVSSMASSTTGLVALSAPLPAGTNALGSVGVSASATANPVASFQGVAATTAFQLPSNVYTNGVTVTVATGAANPICFGGSSSITTTSASYCIQPGASYSWGVANSNQLWAVGSNATDAFSATGN